MIHILLIGSGAREHALAKAIKRSPQPNTLHCFASQINPGIKPLCQHYTIGDITDTTAILAFCNTMTVDFAVIGPEAPLEKGVADALWTHNIPVIGPKQILAQIETSKAFTRTLCKKHQLPGAPRYQHFDTLTGVPAFLDTLGDAYVIKADGLMGGKGVKVSGEHLHNPAEALAYCQSLIDNKVSFVIEEKFIGEEFSLISFSDGVHCAHMPAVQDHKRAFENDTGPNTGGMGSYSDSNHSLPFLTEADISAAQLLNEQVVKALYQDYDEKYIGILYGGFMATANGVKLIEYNARFGDPEAINLLTLLESDFIALCQAMINETLTQTMACFAPLATVCKYAVPEGYPDHPVKNHAVDISETQSPDQLYFAAIDKRDNTLYETGSRSIAVVACAKTIAEAEIRAEAEINRIKGPLFHRKDIGTSTLINKRIKHMATLRNNSHA